MFGRRKHLDILMHRRGVSVYQDGRYLHVDAKLSIKSQRELGTLKDLVNLLADVVNPTQRDEDAEIVAPHANDVI